MYFALAQAFGDRAYDTQMTERSRERVEKPMPIWGLRLVIYCVVSPTGLVLPKASDRNLVRHDALKMQEIPIL